MIKQLKIPKFKNENQERIFWSKLDLIKNFNKADFSPVVFPNLKPSSRSISIRMPEYLLIRLKEQANEFKHSISIINQEICGQGCNPKINNQVNLSAVFC